MERFWKGKNTRIYKDIQTTQIEQKAGVWALVSHKGGIQVRSIARHKSVLRNNSCSHWGGGEQAPSPYSPGMVSRISCFMKEEKCGQDEGGESMWVCICEVRFLKRINHLKKLPVGKEGSRREGTRIGARFSEYAFTCKSVFWTM